MADKKAQPENAAADQQPQNADAEIAAAENAAQREADQRRLDETVAGGRYVINGQAVNANGEPVE